MQHRDRGQSVTEFAFVIPLMLLLVFALIDFSRMLFTYVSITNGARELARVVAITGPWVSNHATDTTNTVNAFNNLTILAGAPAGVQNFSLSPGSGTISCSTMSSSGCTIKLSLDYVASTISFTPVTGGGASGSATYTPLVGSSFPSLATYGVSADGDYAAILLVTEGNSISTQMIGYLQVCPLPMTSNCALANLNMWDGGGGVVEVDTSYTFHYSPLFQNRLTGVIDASFMRPFSVLTTTTRTTGE